MQSPLQEAERIILELQQQVTLLERNLFKNEDEEQELELMVTRNINQLGRLEQSLKQTSGQTIKYKQISDEYLFLRRTIDTCLKKKAQERQQKLLFISNQSSKKSSVDEDPFIERMQERNKQQDSLHKSLQLMQEMLGKATDTTGLLAAQREMLQNTRNRLFEMGTLLGVSQSTLQLIDKRLFTDKWIVYLGMLFIIGLLLFIIYWKSFS